MKKIAVVIINRSNYARLKPLLIELKKNTKINLSIIAGSSSILSKYGEVSSQIKKDGFKIDHEFYSHLAGENIMTMTKSTGLIIMELSSILQKVKPAILLVSADRFETLAVGITASYMNIPLCHLMGGELTGSIDEKVRHSLTKLSDYHFPCTERSKKIITQMGENPKNIWNVGCPSIDLAKRVNYKQTVNLKKYDFGRGFKVDLKKRYLVILIHPDTKKYKENKQLISETCKSLRGINTQVIWLWPNIDAGADLIAKTAGDFADKNKDVKINFYKHFEPEDYLRIINKSICLVGNSSSGIRECSYLGVPVVNIGKRQIFRERSKNVIDVNENHKEINKAIKKQIIKKRYKKSFLYGDGTSSKKITKILEKIKPFSEKKFFIR